VAEQVFPITLARGRRSVVGGIAAAIVIASFGVFFFVFPNWLQRVGSILTVIGALYLVVQLRMRSARAMPDVALSSCLQFYRSELQRQRDFHRGKWFWSRMLIFLPGPIVWFAGFAQARPKLAPFIWGELIAFLILGALAVPLNLRLARAYQRRIDALDLSLRDLG
jgi:hypothetical protein